MYFLLKCNSGSKPQNRYEALRRYLTLQRYDLLHSVLAPHRAAAIAPLLAAIDYYAHTRTQLNRLFPGKFEAGRVLLPCLVNLFFPLFYKRRQTLEIRLIMCRTNETCFTYKLMFMNESIISSLNFFF